MITLETPPIIGPYNKKAFPDYVVEYLAEYIASIERNGRVLDIALIKEIVWEAKAVLNIAKDKRDIYSYSVLWDQKDEKTYVHIVAIGIPNSMVPAEANQWRATITIV